MKTQTSIIVILCALLFLHCKKEVPTTVILEPNTFECNSLLDLKEFLNDQKIEKNFVINYKKENNYFTFYFDDGTQTKLNETCVSEVLKSNWSLYLTLNDGVVYELYTFGQPNVTFLINPFGTTPLSGQLNIEAPLDVEVELLISASNNLKNENYHRFSKKGKELELPVLGLHADFENQLVLNFYSSNSNLIGSDTIYVTTQELPDFFPDITIDIAEREEMEDGLTMVNYLGTTFPNVPFIMDSYGDIRYFIDFSGIDELSSLNFQNGFSRLINGNFLVADAFSNIIYEISLLGEVINTWTLSGTGYRFHHDIHEKSDGNFLITVHKDGSLHSTGLPSSQDYVIELDRTNSQILQEWDLKESLDENRNFLYDNFGTNSINWFHANGVIYDERDNTIIVSGRLQGLVKLDYNNDVVWIMAPHKKWTINRKGDLLDQFLLLPIDQENNPINDTLILQGVENHSNFEWNWSQHTPSILPNGNFMIFENGERRNFTSNKYSRAVEYEINEESGTVKQVWSYGKLRGEECYSRLVSSAQHLPLKDNVLFCPGYQVPNGNLPGGKIVEINQQTKEVVFEARISTPVTDLSFHNAKRIPLYPEGI